MIKRPVLGSSLNASLFLLGQRGKARKTSSAIERV
jgi:hypothetical protein